MALEFSMEEGNHHPSVMLTGRFLDRIRALGWSPRTLESYRYHLTKFLDYVETEANIADLTAVTPEILHSYQMYLYGWLDGKGHGLSLVRFW
jgi:hypothetical protein